MSVALDRVITALEHHGCQPRGNDEKGYMALCPAHDDRTPSLGVREGKDGTVLFKCYADCSTDDVVAAIGLELRDLFSDELPKTRPEIAATYDYVDENGALLYQVVRMDPKAFVQRRPDGAGGWVWKLGDTRRVLYHLPEVVKAREAGGWIMVVEGEKDADALRERGMVATTMPGGAGKWREEYTRTLNGCKVAVITDNDEPGRKHALAVANALDPVVEKLQIWEPVTGKDVRDHLDAGHTMRDLRGPFDRARFEGEGVDKPSLRVMFAEELMQLPGADPAKFLLGPLVYKGHRLVVGAETGAGKTSLITCMAAAALFGTQFLDWTGAGNGLRVLIIDVEQSTDDVQAAWRRSGLDKAGSRCGLIHEPNGLALDSDPDAVKAVEKILSQGWDFVIADPAYNLWSGDPNDMRQVKKIMAQLDEWRRRYDFQLTVPMHTRKPPAGAKFTINEISGNKVFTWGAEEIIGLQRLGNGAASLHWFKDRGGKLPAIHSKWGLLYDQQHGYRKDPRGAHVESTRDRVRAILEEMRDTGATLDDVWFRLGGEDGAPKRQTIRHALTDLGATHGGERLVADRHWRMPPTLFAIDGGSAAVDGAA